MYRNRLVDYIIGLSDCVQLVFGFANDFHASDSRFQSQISNASENI